jgi:DcaP outer membrane protein
MKNIRSFCAALFCCIGTVSAIAQTQDMQQLQEKVRQLEQQTEELKARLAALEKSQPTAPQVTTITRQPAGAPKTTVTVTAQQDQSPLPQPTVSPEASGAPPAQAKAEEEAAEVKPRMDIYGFAQLDMGYDTGQNDPAWFDVMRPTKLPSFENEFGRDGRFYSGVRQSRLGVKGFFNTPLGEVKTIFEFELFGVGAQAGETTFRLRHAWGELAHFGAGQTWSPFMDPDVFPNSLEYWGPNGMVFFRNVQLRWMPVNKGNHQIYLAIERPGASADLGQVASRIELQNVQARFPAPDLSARVRWGGERGHIQVAGIGRYIAWDDLNPVTVNLGGHTWGWGVNVSSNVPVAKKDLVKLSATYGYGIENYMNDAPADIAPIASGNPLRPIDGRPLPVFGLVAFYDRSWSERWTSSAGYSMLKIDNAPLQNPSEFRRGQYGLVNLLYYPAKNTMIGAEFQWGRRNNFSDGFEFNDYRIQLGARYNFDYKLGGTAE